VNQVEETAPELASESIGVAELEALLFVAERPLSRRELASLTGHRPTDIDALLGDLEVALRGRGIRLLSSGERVQLVTAPGAGALIARYVGSDGVRLSAAALEALAIVAYRQPVTRGVIERIRGVDSDYVLRSLMHRRLVVEQGRADTPGRPILYGTGFDFMERFGLTSLEDLPPLATDAAAGLQAAADAEASEAEASEIAADEAEPAADKDAADADADASQAGSTDARG
jgi:segregation and condensation protein B